MKISFGRRRRRRGGWPAVLLVVLIVAAQRTCGDGSLSGEAREPESRRTATDSPDRDAGAAAAADGNAAAPDGEPLAELPAGDPADDHVALARGEQPLRGPVVKIVDGDTLHVELAGSITPIEKVRLLNVNTPERGDRGYERATAALAALASGRTVELLFEKAGKPARDEFGRLLCYVLHDGRCFNLALVRGGWSRWFHKYGEGRYPEAFRAAELEAKLAAAGLWRDGAWNGSLEVERAR